MSKIQEIYIQHYKYIHSELANGYVDVAIII